RAGYPAGEQPVGGGAAVGRERVGDGDLARVAYAGVLDAGDAERVQVLLRGQQGLGEFLLAWRRHVVGDDPHRAVVQRPGRVPLAVPLDPPVGRVGGALDDVGHGQRGAVD